MSVIVISSCRVTFCYSSLAIVPYLSRHLHLTDDMSLRGLAKGVKISSSRIVDGNPVANAPDRSTINTIQLQDSVRWGIE